MTIEQALAFAVLAGTLVMFIWGRFRYDVVAAMALITVCLLGLIDLSQAIAGFGNPAVVTVAAVLVISHALKNSGVVELIGQKLDPLTESPVLHIGSMTLVVALASGFMNNVGAMAVMLPVALASCARRNRSPAIVLMPLAFGSLLGGLMTMIGTPPNILIAQYRAEALGESFGMFDYAWVGLPIALIGVLFISLVGWRLLPKERRGKRSADQLFEIDSYFTEVCIGEKSSLIGLRYQSAQVELGQDVEMTGRVSDDGRLTRIDQTAKIKAGDLLILKADPTDLRTAIGDFDMELASETPAHILEMDADNLMLMEAVVSPGSRIAGRSVRVFERWAAQRLHVLAIARQGRPLRRRLMDVRIEEGDVLLMRGDEIDLSETLTQLNLLPLPERGLQLTKPRRVWASLLIFAIAIGFGITGVLPTAVAFIGAIVAYILFNILSPREVYSAIDWPIIILLAALIPVGQALEQTGTTLLIAQQIVNLTDALPPWALLALVMIVTMCLSDVINNAATVVVMAPIGIAIAVVIDSSPDPFLMAIAVAASCAFLTPIGHQSNTLVMGAGGYRFGDYWRMGLPLEILIVALGVPMLLFFWPM
ncbi:MAG: SLC13/DASS family transporter [Wenzhouxiangella sp.]|nr:SLC13/DASS family transporter [Wenzhouxiangella sp.]